MKRNGADLILKCCGLIPGAIHISTVILGCIIPQDLIYGRGLPTAQTAATATMQILETGSELWRFQESRKLGFHADRTDDRGGADGDSGGDDCSGNEGVLRRCVAQIDGAKTRERV